MLRCARWTPGERPRGIATHHPHAIAPHRPRQTFCAAIAARLGRCAAARASGQRAQGRIALHRGAGRRSGRRAASGRRVAVLRARSARGRVPRLGDAALRHLLPAPGPRVRAPRHVVAPAAARPRRGAAAGHHRADAARADPFPCGNHVQLQARHASRRIRAEGPAHAGWVQPREPGRVAGRIRRAWRPDRPVSDGLAGAVPRGPVRRPGRLDPHLRPRHAAQPLPGARGAPAARPRVRARRRGARGLPLALARAHRRRPHTLAHLQGHGAGHRRRRHRVLPAAVLRPHGDDLRLPGRRNRRAVPRFRAPRGGRRSRSGRQGAQSSGGFGAARRPRRRDRPLLGRHPRAPPLPAARPRAADPAAGGDLPARRRVFCAHRDACHSGAAPADGRRRRSRPCVGGTGARRQRGARFAGAAGSARRPDRLANHPGAADRRERRPAREPARAAARPPHPRAERVGAGRVRRQRRTGRDCSHAARARLRVETRRRAVDHVHHRNGTLRRHTRLASAPPPGGGERRRGVDQGLVRAAGRRSGGAHQPRHRALPRTGEPRPRRRRRQRIPASRLRRRRHAVRAGGSSAPDQPLHRRRCIRSATAQARLGPVGQGQAQGRRAGARHRGRAAQPVCTPRRARRPCAPLLGARLRGLRGRLRLRRNAGPARRDPRGDPGHDQPQADGPPGVRRCRLRQDRGRAARRVHRRARRQAGGAAGTDHAAGRAALPDHQRPLRQVAGQGGRAVALSHRQGDQRRARGPDRRQHRHRGRHAQAAQQRRAVQAPGPAGDRRGAPLRRAPQGGHQGDALRGRRAHAHRHADPAHAGHGARRPARPERDRHRAAAPAGDQDLRAQRGQQHHPRGRAARIEARRPGVLPAQRGRVDPAAPQAPRESWCPRRASRWRTARCPNANSSR